MSELARAVDEVAATTGFSGVVRVDRGDELVLATAYGLAHRGARVANTVDTPFGIASGTKGMTAVTVMSLIEDGDYVDEEAMESATDYVMPIPVHRLASTEDYLEVLAGHPRAFA